MLHARTVVPRSASKILPALRGLGRRPLGELLFLGQALRAGVTRERRCALRKPPAGGYGPPPIVQGDPLRGARKPHHRGHQPRPGGSLGEVFRDNRFPMTTAAPSSSLRPYLQLTRLDKPVGIGLLLWPTLWALWLAAEGASLAHPRHFPSGCGADPRSAGCAINDYADRNFDGHVARTQHRPLATGALQPRDALLTAAALTVLAFILVLFTNPFTVALAPVAVVLAALYPLYEALPALSPAVPCRGVLLGDPHGLCRRARGPTASPLVARGGQCVLDLRLRHGIRHGRSALGRDRGHSVHRPTLRPL